MVRHSDGQPGESEVQCKCSSVVRASIIINNYYGMPFGWTEPGESEVQCNCSSVVRASIIFNNYYGMPFGWTEPGESEVQCNCSSVVRASKYMYTVPEVVGCEL